MTATKVLNQLTGKAKYGPMNDQRITICKICLVSILIGQPTVWLTKPMGLSHTTCAGTHRGPAA